MKSPSAPRQRDRRLVFVLFLAATFGMMIVLSLPLAGFIPLSPRVPGLLGFPSFLDPLRPLIPAPEAGDPPEAVGRADARISRVLAPILPPGTPGSEPGAVPAPVSPTGRGQTVPECPAGDSSEQRSAGDRRTRKGPSGKKRAGAGPTRRCELTSPGDGLPRTKDRAWTIPRHHLHGARAVTKHGQKHWGDGHHKPKKDHKPKKK